MSERDPRRDPRVGDVLRNRHGQIRVIRELGPGESLDMKLYRKWAKDATVVKRGDA